MAEDEPKVHSDVPKSTALVRTRDDAVALARETAGKLPPNKCLFHCISCGWKGTLEFNDEEIEALGDISIYGGPCSDCKMMTLVSSDKLMGDEFRSIQERARENRMEEYNDAADVFVDRVKQEVVGVMGGSTLDPSSEEKQPDDRPPGQRDDLPETGEVGLDDLKGRSE